MNATQAAFALPWPPSVNTAYRSIVIGGAPRVLLSRAGREYKRRAAYALLTQRVPSFGTQRVAIEVTVFPPDRRARDLGNLDKLVMDALTPRVITDDSQIDYLVWDRRTWHLVPDGRLELTVTALTYTTPELDLTPARNDDDDTPFPALEAFR